MTFGELFTFGSDQCLFILWALYLKDQFSIYWYLLEKGEDTQSYHTHFQWLIKSAYTWRYCKISISVHAKQNYLTSSQTWCCSPELFSATTQSRGHPNPYPVAIIHISIWSPTPFYVQKSLTLLSPTMIDLIMPSKCSWYWLLPSQSSKIRLHKGEERMSEIVYHHSSIYQS